MGQPTRLKMQLKPGAPSALLRWIKPIRLFLEKLSWAAETSPPQASRLPRQPAQAVIPLQPKSRGAAMIRDISVVLDGRGERAGPYALSLAQRLDAMLTGICMVPEMPFENFADAEIR